MSEVIKRFFTSFVLLTLLCGLAFMCSQQVYRQGANDPQAQMANDTAVALSKGTPFVSTKTVDIATEQSAFTIIYDVNGEIVSSEAVLDTKTPKLPNGVLAYAKRNNGSTLTWQPKEDVRIATVIKPYDKGFVLVGRSLKQTELRVDNLLRHVAIFWLVSNLIMLCVIFITKRKNIR